MSREVWKDIEGYEGYYQVSNTGKVKSIDRYFTYNDGKNSFRRGKVLKQVLRCGYKFITLAKDNKKLPQNIHRLVAKAFIPNPENKPCVHHKDHNKKNNNADNLMWVSHKENTNYAIQEGIVNVQGSSHPMAVLDEWDIILIRDSIELGRTATQIAKELNVTNTTICNIKNGKNWKHI